MKENVVVKRKKIRSSNFELLRIIAMLIIIIYHITRHSVVTQLVDSNSIEYMKNGFFCHPEFYKELFLVQGALPWGITANALFIMISGYFMVEKGKKINLGKITTKLLLQIVFSAVVLTIASYIFYQVSDLPSNTLTRLRSITDLNESNWFAGLYLLIMILARMFLNEHLQNLDKKSYRNLLIVLFGLVAFGWSGHILEGLISGLRLLVLYVFVYALGGYIKRFNPFKNIRVIPLLLVIACAYALLYISYYNNVINSIHNYQNQPTEIFIQSFLYFDNFALLPILFSIVIFELFRRLRIPNSKIINYLGSSTFMIYLMHDNDFFRYLWREYDWIKLLSSSTAQYCERLIKQSLSIFVLGVITYCCFLLISKLCSKCRWLVYRKDYNNKVCDNND